MCANGSLWNTLSRTSMKSTLSYGRLLPPPAVAAAALAFIQSRMSIHRYDDGWNARAFSGCSVPTSNFSTVTPYASYTHASGWGASSVKMTMSSSGPPCVRSDRTNAYRLGSSMPLAMPSTTFLPLPPLPPEAAAGGGQDAGGGAGAGAAPAAAAPAAASLSLAGRPATCALTASSRSDSDCSAATCAAPPALPPPPPVTPAANFSTRSSSRRSSCATAPAGRAPLPPSPAAAVAAAGAPSALAPSTPSSPASSDAPLPRSERRLTSV
jgi:hypothetical protein